MTRAPPRTEAVPRREFRAFLAKATEFIGTARTALTDLRPNSAGLEAIHAVISACDALTVGALGLRCRGEDHRDVLQLIDQVRQGSTADLKRQVSQVLAAKSLVEYGGEGLTTAQAERLVLQAERVVASVTQWTRS